MMPMALFSKKRYAYIEWTDPEKPHSKISQIGTQIIRRDTCTFARGVLYETLRILLQENDQVNALKYIRKEIKDLLEGDVETSRLVLTRALKSTYANPNVAHVLLAQKMRERNDVNQCEAGDRIAYVHIEDTNQTKRVCIEDPVFADANKLRVDYMHYFSKQLETPIKMVFSLFMEPSHVYADLLEQARRTTKKEKDIAGFLKLFHSE